MKANKNFSKGYKLEDILIFVALITPGFADFSGKLPLNFTQLIILMLFLITILKSVKSNRIKIPKFIINLIYYIIIITFILNNNGFESLKTVGIFFIYLYTIFMYVYKKEDLGTIIKLLYNLSFIVAIIGIVQEIGYVIKIEALYNYSWIGINNTISSTGGLLRVTSIFSEPAHLATVLLPGICLFMINFLNGYKLNGYKMDINNKMKNITILVCSFFTFSMVVYLSVFIAAIYFIVTERKKLMKNVGIIFISTFLIIYLNSIYGESLEIITYKFQSLFTLNTLDTNNLSSFAWISNFKIAIQKMKDGYILGTGMDSHINSYFEYINSIYAGNRIIMYLNYEDAASLYIRIFSEFGILGIVVYVIYIYKMFIINVAENVKKSNTYIINRICLICMVCYGIRMGGYISVYWVLMLMVVIVSNRRLKNKVGEENDG